MIEESGPDRLREGSPSTGTLLGAPANVDALVLGAACNKAAMFLLTIICAGRAESGGQHKACDTGRRAKA